MNGNVLSRMLWTAGWAPLLLILGCQKPNSKELPGKQAPIQVVQKALVRVAPAETSTLTDRCELPGTVEPWETVLLSTETEGRAERVAVQEGDSVSAGDLIALIDAEALKAEYDAAKLRYEEAERSFQRLEKLFSLKNVTEDEMDRAKTVLLLAEAQLKVAKIHLDKSEVRTTVTGRVNSKSVEEGEYLTKGKLVVDIVVLDPLKFVVAVPEKDIAHIHENDQASVAVQSLDLESVPAQVHRVALTGDTRTNTFTVELKLSNPDGRIKPGMIGRATFIKRRLENVISVPLFAVVHREERSLLFLADQGKARSKDVVLGVVDGDRVQIVEGIQIGDPVIVQGGRNLDDGTEIESEPIPVSDPAAEGAS